MHCSVPHNIALSLIIREELILTLQIQYSYVDPWKLQCFAQENEFRTGLSSNLVPWIDRFKIKVSSLWYEFMNLAINDFWHKMKLMITRLEKESFKTLDKPESFAHAQEIEKEAVLFAKEVSS